MKALLVSGLLAGAVFSSADAAVSPNIAKQLGTAIADAVDKAMPSVVVVRTEAVKYYVARDWYYRLWQVPERLAGQGSGVVISKDGYVLTNNHVIDEAENIEVAFSDGTLFPAEIVAADPHTDLAVLKIKSPKEREFKSIQVGDSDAVRVGEFAIAVGSPLSLGSSVTFGIVSAKGRAIGLLPYEDFIQTDAAINMGNSGGPLLDVDGRMIGVNTVIQTTGDSRGNIGISFAIPANLAINVAQSLIKNGKWQRPWIGISMSEEGGHVLIDEISEAGPAAKTSLKTGDVILAVNGADVKVARDVQREILQQAPGGKIALKIDRAGKLSTIDVTPAEMPQPRRVRR